MIKEKALKKFDPKNPYLREEYFNLFYYRSLLLDFLRDFSFTSNIFQLITVAVLFEENTLLVIKLLVD